MNKLMTILFCFTWVAAITQPDPNNFLVGNIDVHVDSGTNAHYFLFMEGSDSIEIRKNQFKQTNSVNAKFSKDTVVEIITPFVQHNSIYGINYLNSKNEEVYVYLFSSIDKNGLVNLHSGHRILIESLDLKKGTYFVDWSSYQKKRFHRKIGKNVKQWELKLQDQIDSLHTLWLESWERLEKFKSSQTITEFTKDSIRKYAELYESQLREVQQIKSDYMNDNTRFLGYYKTYTMSESINEEPLTFVITEKAVKKQKISSKVINPEAFSAFIRNDSKMTNQQMEIMLGALNYSSLSSTINLE